ncbi:pectinesterase family protein, partial [Ralstonia pseudosolanacearum]|uniref:pectinesterase family protein n=1 Tax=Ralstonia pseudosolanacearum TaxID=1310165 RepID=UPI003D1763C3
MELTRNGLAIIDQIASVITSYNIPLLQRRLLSSEEEFRNVSEDGFPTWVTPEKRRLLATRRRRIRANIVVAKDGSGKYRTINEALNDIPKRNVKPFVIRIKEGVYDEIVRINQTNVMIIGDGPQKTKITGNRSFHTGYKTIETATFVAAGHGFIAKDIGFENSAGAEGHQAVALRAHSDLSVFHNCQID